MFTWCPPNGSSPLYGCFLGWDLFALNGPILVLLGLRTFIDSLDFLGGWLITGTIGGPLWVVGVHVLLIIRMSTLLK